MYYFVVIYNIKVVVFGRSTHCVTNMKELSQCCFGFLHFSVIMVQLMTRDSAKDTLPLLCQITQIGLSAYQIICVSVFMAKDLSNTTRDVLFFIASLLVRDISTFHT